MEEGIKGKERYSWKFQLNPGNTFTSRFTSISKSTYKQISFSSKVKIRSMSSSLSEYIPGYVAKCCCFEMFIKCRSLVEFVIWIWQGNIVDYGCAFKADDLAYQSFFANQTKVVNENTRKTPKPSPTFVLFFFSLSSLFLDGLAEAFHWWVTSSYPRHGWPRTDLFYWKYCLMFLSKLCWLLCQMRVASTNIDYVFRSQVYKTQVCWMTCVAVSSHP